MRGRVGIPALPMCNPGLAPTQTSLSRAEEVECKAPEGGREGARGVAIFGPHAASNAGLPLERAFGPKIVIFTEYLKLFSHYVGGQILKGRCEDVTLMSGCSWLNGAVLQLARSKKGYQRCWGGMGRLKGFQLLAWRVSLLVSSFIGFVKYRLFHDILTNIPRNSARVALSFHLLNKMHMVSCLLVRTGGRLRGKKTRTAQQSPPPETCFFPLGRTEDSSALRSGQAFSQYRSLSKRKSGRRYGHLHRQKPLEPSAALGRPKPTGAKEGHRREGGGGGGGEGGLFLGFTHCEKGYPQNMMLKAHIWNGETHERSLVLLAWSWATFTPVFEGFSESHAQNLSG